eukprot:TRINITY_DN2303_c0_g1_i1.p1 TRINITY_DN2303_c0_g1~~TRINITY_DN2303_c0_g1_i1.p1  ORF type:complete len:220 (-),score=62.40 TRINITY_DN2303_c0_g1_i1:299-898(-)
MNDERLFRALLNAVYKRDFEGVTSLTTAVIQQELGLSSLPISEIETTLNACTQLLRKGAEGDLSLAQFESLSKQEGFSDVQVLAANKFWKTNKEKVLSLVRKQNIWNDTLSKFSWRIDIQSRARSSNEEINQPTSIFELQINSKGCQQDDTKITPTTTSSATKESQTKIVRFEMNKEQMAVTLQQINSIQKIIEEISRK